MHEVRADVRPVWAFRLPGGSMEGLWRRRGGVLERLLHVEGAPAVVRAAQPATDRVVVGAWAGDRDVAAEALARLRAMLGVDDDLRPFYEAHRLDPLIGPSVRRRPWLRPLRRPAFEALAFAVCEQLIELRHAARIERRMVGALGARCPRSGLRDAPPAGAVASCAPARFESWDLAPSRALTLLRVAREVARGRFDLDDPGQLHRAEARLATIPGVGSWTLDCLALHGHGRLDRLPAGDLGYRKLVGRWRSGGHPAARVDEEEVRAVFARFGRWAALAGAHALGVPAPAPAALVA